MFSYNSEISRLIDHLNDSQRQKFKDLILEFIKENNSNGVKFDRDNFSLEKTVEDMEWSEEYDKRRRESSEAAEKGETTIPKDKWGVHETHCCSVHGCKYGDEDCPVSIGLTGGVRCESCDYNYDDYNDQAKYVNTED